MCCLTINVRQVGGRRGGHISSRTQGGEEGVRDTTVTPHHRSTSSITLVTEPSTRDKSHAGGPDLT